jgi:outer membrane protein assembly factor BamE
MALLQKLLMLVLIIMISSISGCTFFTPYKTPITQGTIINNEAIDTLQNGLTMEQIRQILGPPFGQNPFDPRHWEYMFYTTDKLFQPNIIKHLKLIFDEENYLKDWVIIINENPTDNLKNS